MRDRDLCATCSVSLPERGPNSPTVRYCEDHWWAEQVRRYDAGEHVADTTVSFLTATPPEKRKPPQQRVSEWLGIRHGS